MTSVCWTGREPGAGGKGLPSTPQCTKQTQRIPIVQQMLFERSLSFFIIIIFKCDINETFFCKLFPLSVYKSWLLLVSVVFFWFGSFFFFLHVHAV